MVIKGWRMFRFKPDFEELNEETALRIARRCDLSLVVARIMAGRGMDENSAEAFLNCGRESLHDPFLMDGMRPAVRRIHAAIENGEKIVVYGDYDVDGVTATVVLYSALRDMGANAEYYLPSRQGDGYGLHCNALEQLRSDGAQLLITVDCGITALQEAAHANALGLDMIITDHHQPLPQLPDCHAIVSPLLGKYPTPWICGAGVAAKLVQALLGPDSLEEYFDLIALGTVADVVPLSGENRAFVRLGLDKMNAEPRLALRLLLEQAGFSGQMIDAQTLAYIIAPRINAAGRLEDASLAVDMLTATQKPPHVRDLELLNRRRQDVEQQILEQAEEMLQGYDWKSKKAIVLCGQGWHHGVAGIVASRLLERYYRPVAMLCRDGEICTGSLRSIPGVNIFEILKGMGHLFQRFGGHSAAAGLTMEYDKLEAFENGMNESLRLVPPESFIPCVTYDAALQVADINLKLAEDIERLAPFGQGNREPRFLISKATFENAKAVGKNGNHLRVSLRQGGAKVDAVAFGQGQVQEAFLDWSFDVVAGVEQNRWNGTVKPQCKIRRFKLSQQAETLPEDKFLDAFLEQILYNNKNRPNLALASLAQWEKELDNLPLWVEGSAILCGSPKSAEAALKALRSRGIDRFWNSSIGKPVTAVPYNALVIAPEPGVDYSSYEQVFALDCFFPPRADTLCFTTGEQALLPFLSRAVLEREQLGKIYRFLMRAFADGRRFCGREELLTDIGEYALSFALAVFGELGFFEVRGGKVLLPRRENSQKRDLNESLTYRTAWEIYDYFLGKREH